MSGTRVRRSAASAISLRSVSKGYGPVRAVRDLSLEVRPGETVALLGHNGAGKSTTVAMLLGLVGPDTGRALVCGHDPARAVQDGLIAAMLQDAGMMPGVRVAELVGLAHRAYPSPLPVARALELAGLTEVASRRVDRLSGGQAQRLRFAVAVVADPEIVVLDEPTRALDVRGRAEFWEAMRAYAASGRTLLFATHYLDEVDENAGRVVVMAKGRVIADGTPAEIRGRVGGGTVRFSCDAGHGAFAALPGVTGVEVRGERVLLRTADADVTVRALAAGVLPWRDLRVTPASLDESFLMLTEEAS
ncbi:ABC transporter ATP-binding protein [Planotetraspora sp. A-T 1434]|uniref:ABC transporter ATP-binding protein n=1 Tax=Planotetraspora sp. A-T 1434 TaxID=2979219 RepID=UPI0021BEE569|nr:ABC transporter ATP-binding protein [Planotetraspora sp. A-T 1434]MCT9933246.1 ABC transporter ATP-binding protein [Planotetraspora sp. A-T 1434]